VVGVEGMGDGRLSVDNALRGSRGLPDPAIRLQDVRSCMTSNPLSGRRLNMATHVGATLRSGTTTHIGQSKDSAATTTV
jgi:hypothetical protein